MQTKSSRAKTSVITFIFVYFWSEYLFHDVYLASLLALVSAILTLAPKNRRFIDEKNLPAFSHFLGFDGESAQNLVRSLTSGTALGNGSYLADDTVYKVDFSYSGISADEMVRIAKTASCYANRLVVYARRAETDVIKPFLPITLEIRSEKKLYYELKEKNMLPAIPERFYNSGAKARGDGKWKKAGYLILSALSVLFSSLFSPIKLFFLLSASILLILAFIIVIRGNRSVVKIEAK